MALIPVVGRKSPAMRLLVAVLYLALSLGAVSMVYPFLVMIGSSLTSQYDQDKYAIVPRYLYSDTALFGKYAEDKFGADMTKLNAAYGTTFAKLQDVVPPKNFEAARVQDWDTFAKNLPDQFKTAGFGGATGSYSPSLLLDRYHAYLRRLFHDDISTLNKAYTQEDASFDTVFPPFEQPTKQGWTPGIGQKDKDWAAFQQTLPQNFFQIIGGDSIYQRWLKEEAYAKLDDLNKAWGTRYQAFSEIRLTPKPGGAPSERRDWEKFVRTKLPFRDVQVSAAAQPAYDAYLQSRYKGNLSRYNAENGTNVSAFTQIALPAPTTIPPSGPPLINWIGFLKTAAPLAALSVDTPETRWHSALPLRDSDWAYTQAHTGQLRWDFAARNYALVIQYIALHGNGVLNTIVFCGLAILTALIVNPLCAYALSRYNLPYGNAVLLFLLTTMAFPAEVALIPNFLLLKQLGLLNTFAALILPGAASGFSIFLMKGFFDSLPRELYEAGTLDGATELTMFRAITLPLSRPIFAVIALNAFTASYGAFLFALLVCQKREMWTLMVWLYELQANQAPQAIMMAALTLAAIPTLFVFIFAQKTIMEGIILPSFK